MFLEMSSERARLTCNSSLFHNLGAEMKKGTQSVRGSKRVDCWVQGCAASCGPALTDTAEMLLLLLLRND